MAAVTLKDLMDPLVKIAAATEKTAQKIDAVVAAVAGGPGASLNQEIILELKTQTDLLKIIAGKSGSSKSDTPKEQNSGKSGTLKEAGNTLVALGAGAKELAMGLIIFRFVPKKGVETFINVITDLFELYDKNKPNKKNVQETAESVNLIGLSIYGLGTMLAKSFLKFTVGYLAARLFLVTINILLPTFDLIGDNKNIQKGADTLDVMGGALNKFAKGLVIAAIGSVIGILFTPVIVLAMLLIGGAFALLGKIDKTIRQGARSTRMMGNALIYFAVGLAMAALASMLVLMNPVVLLAMVGSLVLVGGAFALLGLVDKHIRKGALAIFVMSVSLVIFSIGYLIFAAVAKDVTMEDIFRQGGLLLGTGLAFAVLGKLFGQIVPGAIAVAAIGIGLLVFSLGYLPFAAVTKDMTLESIGVQSGILLALGLEFAAAGVGSLFILAGAGAFAAVGIALLLLAPGLLAIKKVNFTQEDSVKLATMLAGVKSAFLGGKDADEGFFSKIGGAITGAIDSVRMIEAAAGFIAAGVALKTLAWGLTAIKAVGWNDELSKELVTMLNGITTAFALAGSSEQVPSSSFFGQMFGFKRTAVEEGISSVMGAGRALTSIAKGLQAFQSLIDKGVNFGSPDSEGRYEKGTLGYAVVNTVGFINEAFAAVAEQGNVEAGGFFNSLFGIKKNKVAEGIDSVKGAGKELTNIATGLKSFQDLIDKDINWDRLGDAVTKSLGFIGTAFAKIGGMESEDSTGLSRLFGISWDENSVEKGVDAVQGAGKELMNIASGLKTFQDMIANNVDFDKLGYSIKNTLMFVGDAFASIGGKEESDGWFGIGLWDENLVKKGIDNVKGAGEELTNIAKGLQSFADLKNPAAIAKSIKEIFTSIGDTFTYYYEKPKFKSQVDHMQGFISEISKNAGKGLIHKAADGMSKMAAAINKIDADKAESFANLFKGAGELSNNAAAYAQLLSAVEDIRDALNVSSTGTTTTAATGTNSGGGDSKGLDSTLKSINSALANLNGTMNRLPAAIQSIQIIVPD